MGAYLERRRREARLSQRDVAYLTDGIVDRSWLSRLERADATSQIQLHVVKLTALAQVYKVPLEVVVALAGIKIEIPKVLGTEWAADLLREHSLGISELH